MPSNKPNILLITTDQQHWDTLGVANPLIKTPPRHATCGMSPSVRNSRQRSYSA